MNNTLDVTAYLQLDYGEGKKQVVVLPPHIVTPLTQPMPLPPVSHAPMTASQPPPVRLVIDILSGKLLTLLGAAGSAPELMVKVRGHWCDVMPGRSQGAATDSC